MSTVSHAILDIYECAQASSPNHFNEYGISVTKKLLGFNSASIVGFHAPVGKAISIQTIHFHNTPIEKLHDRPKVTGIESVTENHDIQSNDLILAQAFRRQGRCIAADTSLIFDRRRNAEHLAYCAKYETAHSLVLVGQRKSEKINLVALWRAHPKNHYSKHELYIGNQILPHLLQAHEVNKRITAVSVNEDKNRDINLIASENGVLYFCDTSAISLMQSEWREWTPPLLPSAMIEALRSSKLMQFQTNNIIVTATLQNSLLCIKISKTAKSQNLTIAEHRVAQMASQGLSHKEIAKILGNSPSTIRNQLHSVYQKLNIANKTALAQLMATIHTS